MKLVFLGTPQFAVPTLEAIVKAGHSVAAVFTQPDRPQGRNLNVHKSPVKEAAERLGIPVHQPERVRRPEVVRQLAALGVDAMVIVGYGQLIPQSIIDLVPHGIINLHASLLPKYRGAAPVQWAIASGEQITGVTTMRIDAGLDTGAILQRQSTRIGPNETAVSLSARLALLGSELMVGTLTALESGEATPEPQLDSEATYAPILKKEDGRIDWTQNSRTIANRLRGFLPWPGAYTTFRSHRLHIWSAKADDRGLGAPGSLHVANRCLKVACGESTSLQIEELQLEGRKRVGAAEFLNGQRLTAADILGEKTN